MKNEDPPLHHYPSVQGMHQLTNTTPDAWEEFFSECWDWYEEVLRRRQMKQKASAEQQDVEANTPVYHNQEAK